MNSDQQAAAVQARIAELREHLSIDAQEVSQGAKAMADWRYYPRRFPWATVALTAAAGYLLVPKKARRASAAANDGDGSPRGRRNLEEAKQQSGIIGGLVGSLASIVAAGLMRAGSAYVGNRLTGMIPHHAAHQEFDTNGHTRTEY